MNKKINKILKVIEVIIICYLAYIFYNTYYFSQNEIINFYKQLKTILVFIAIIKVSILIITKGDD